MTTLTDTQVITASGGLVELGYSQIVADVNTTTTSTGTSATSVISAMTVVCDGGPVLIEFSSPRVDSGASSNITISLLKDGAEFVRTWGFINPGGTNVPVQLKYRDTPTAGSHTYEVRAYRGGANNGTIFAGNTTAGSAPAFLRVSKIVQATQWPAVTTGTIICTSSTRPASPFEGQRIYETDTDRELVWNASAWVAPQVVSRTPGAYIYGGTAADTVTDAVMEHVVGLSSVGFDSDSMTSTANRITIKKAGLYLVHGSFYTDTGTTSDYAARVEVRRYNSGGTLQDNPGAYLRGPNNIGWSNGPALTIFMDCAVNDYIQLWACIDGTDATSARNVNSPRLQAVCVGATPGT